MRKILQQLFCVLPKYIFAMYIYYIRYFHYLEKIISRINNKIQFLRTLALTIVIITGLDWHLKRHIYFVALTKIFFDCIDDSLWDKNTKYVHIHTHMSHYSICTGTSGISHSQTFYSLLFFLSSKLGFPWKNITIFENLALFQIRFCWHNFYFNLTCSFIKKSTLPSFNLISLL